MAGAKMLTNYPTSIVVHGVALNITVQTYNESLDIGIIACAQAMPEVDEFARTSRRPSSSSRACRSRRARADLRRRRRPLRSGASEEGAGEEGRRRRRLPAGRRPRRRRPSLSRRRHARLGQALQPRSGPAANIGLDSRLLPSHAPHAARSTTPRTSTPTTCAPRTRLLLAMEGRAPWEYAAHARRHALAAQAAARRRPPGAGVPRPRRQRLHHRRRCAASSTNWATSPTPGARASTSARARACSSAATTTCGACSLARAQGQPDRLEPGRHLRARAGQGTARPRALRHHAGHAVHRPSARHQCLALLRAGQRPVGARPGADRADPPGAAGARRPRSGRAATASSSWRCSVVAPSPLAENIEVHASHVGMGMNPLALYADRRPAGAAGGPLEALRAARRAALVLPHARTEAARRLMQITANGISLEVDDHGPPARRAAGADHGPGHAARRLARRAGRPAGGAGLSRHPLRQPRHRPVAALRPPRRAQPRRRRAAPHAGPAGARARTGWPTWPTTPRR